MSETMRREIHGQPALLGELLPALRAGVAGLELTGSRRVIAGGCGDGHFAAGTAAGLFHAAGVDYRPASAMEIAYHQPLRQDDLVILLSISGNTRRTVEAARRAREAGAGTLAIGCSARGELSKHCQQTLLLPFQPLSRATPHTADYLATLLALAVLAERWRGERDISLDALPALVMRILDLAREPASAFAADYDPTSRLFVLGQGPNLATAGYIAAKFHEAGGLPAFPLETENFVHGPNFMLEPDDRVCLLANDGEGAFRARELLPGLARLCRRVVCTETDFEPMDGTADGLLTIATPPLSPALSVFSNAVVGQLLCLAVVEALGLAVESPRAGRAGGALHGEIQNGWMRDTRT